MKILVTGAAGFIGFHLCEKLITAGHEVVGLDNINDYYDVNLKYARLNELGINKEDAAVFNETAVSAKYRKQFQFIRLNLQDREILPLVFKKYGFKVVVNLAAQAGVRYSIENPEAYIDSNVVGFLNILECCRHHDIKHLLYASSSSVYGENKKVPFSELDNVDYPISLYAATKKSNELMAYTYSQLYGIPTTGLRFFTVYGPWGRPDMAMFLFTDAILNNKSIAVFNNGKLERDFTFIDDIITGISKIIHSKRFDNSSKYSMYNIGNGVPVKLLDFITELENQLGKIAKKDMVPMQLGDVSRTWADTTELRRDFQYSPKIEIKEGVGKFIKWHRKFYKI